MQLIDLSPQPAQEFTLVISNVIYRIRIFDIDGQMAADFRLNGEDAIRGTRCLHGVLMLPYPSLELHNGNFMFFEDTGGDVDWRNFGNTCRFYYITPSELAAARAA